MEPNYLDILLQWLFLLTLLLVGLVPAFIFRRIAKQHGKPRLWLYFLMGFAICFTGLELSFYSFKLIHDSVHKGAQPSMFWVIAPFIVAAGVAILAILIFRKRIGCKVQ